MRETMLFRGGLPSSRQLCQGGNLSSRTYLRGQCLAFKSQRVEQRSSGKLLVRAEAAVAEPKQSSEAERFRLYNIAPQPGARRKNKRKGRGYGAGQGGSCGYGMRGQNSRSGSGTRPGFEGGQMPLYRRVPKLKGIAGGMGAGQTKFVIVNLKKLSEKFSEGEEVSLESLKEKRVLNVSGREAKLPLKVLGDGELSSALTIRATEFSASAREKIEKAGGKIVEVPKKIKWTRAIGKTRAQEKAAQAQAAEQKKGKSVKQSKPKKA